MPSSTLTRKGQTTIPREVRQHLGLQPGDRIEYVIVSGEVVLKAATVNLLDLAGKLHRANRKPVSLDELKQLVRSRTAGR